MATGYTHAVADGTITDLRPFALSCSRAFGALVMLRDEPFDAEVTDKAFVPSDYNAKALDEAKARLAEVAALSDEACGQEARKAHKAATAAYLKQIDENSEKRARYESMRRKVEAWTPPTSDHAGLRAFMLEQLAESVKWDCNYTPPVPTMQTGAEWRNAAHAGALKDVAYHTKANQEEADRCASRKEWWTALVNSL